MTYGMLTEMQRKKKKREPKKKSRQSHRGSLGGWDAPIIGVQALA